MLGDDLLSGDPMARFHELFERAQRSETFEASRAALATADASGQPSVRFVLVKEAGARGFVFYTDFRSRKARDLAENPRGALAWHWESIGVQVRAEGPVERAGDAVSDAYFATRPRGSQIGAWASQQSATIGGRDELEARCRELAEHFAGEPVPRPETWGGFVLVPEHIEIWLNRDDRLHDRFVFEREGEGWRSRRVSP